MKKNGRKIVNVLLVEDNPVDARLAQEVLKHCRLYQCQTKLVDSLAAAKKHLGRNTTDAILLDLGLPDSAGLETYFKIREVAPRVPVVILSASGDQDSALAAIQDGAKDYLIKSAASYQYLDRAIRYAVESGRVERTIFEGTEKLQEVSMAAIRMADIGPDEDLNALITKSLRSLSGAMITHISVVKESSLLTVQHIDGLPEILKKAVSMLGVPLEGLEYELDADIFAALRSGEPHLATDLSETVSLPSLAPGIINKIQKLLGIGEILFLPLRYGNTLIGVCTAVFDKNTAPDKFLPQFMTAFTNAAAIALQRHEVQRQLQESEEKYRRLVEQANDGIVIIQDGLVTYANASAAEMKGEPLEEMIGRPFVDNVIPEHLSMIGDYYSALMRGDEIPQGLEIEFVSPEGQPITIDINASLIDHQGQPAVMAGLRDTTERKEATDK
ncbi:MAG: response regulator, partial [Candidatus Marinimicrobia bacterium]|nr:response regulator [Candidatus Neomarinimicrobiota bacterium]